MRFVRRTRQRAALAVTISALFFLVTGCRTASFYWQAANGQLHIWSSQESVDYLLKDPALPGDLKARFEMVRTLREFADVELNLRVDGHYWKYLDLGREYVVWNVQAAPEFSLEPKTWWYPFVGRQEYRGYFSERGATNYANYLERQGFEVYVGGVDAYSTLGWFKDPLLNTFIYQPDPLLADLLFHELAHQRLFASGDTDFNESFATFVGQEGTRQWLRRNRPKKEIEVYQAYLDRNEQFERLALEARNRLELLYGDTRDEAGRIRSNRLPNEDQAGELRREKARILLELERRFTELRANWGGASAYDGWFSRPVNNAQLNSLANYYAFVPGFKTLFEEQNSDWRKFYQAATKLSRLPQKERHDRLQKLGAPQPPASNR